MCNLRAKPDGLETHKKFLFKEYNCGHRRDMIYIPVDMDSEVVKAVLCLIYKGTTYLPPNAVEELKKIVKMLDFQFNGGFERVQMTGASKIPLYPTQVISKTSLKRPRFKSPSWRLIRSNQMRIQKYPLLVALVYLSGQTQMIAWKYTFP